MSIYKTNFSANNLNPLKSFLPTNVFRHISELKSASPNSQYFYKEINKTPNFFLCLIEQNHIEAYTLCHLYSYDQIGEDYSYQSLSLDQVDILTQFVSQLKIS
ncbi:hypothetical protein SAMN05428961_11314 [Paenibacillus sp. OK060]|nr:hypothetical protein SAMN05428961_11314 [Paenibacillus sp. OK060]